MKIKGREVTMCCPKCDTELICNGTMVTPYDENDDIDVEYKVEYGFYCGICDVDIITESYISRHRNFG